MYVTRIPLIITANGAASGLAEGLLVGDRALRGPGPVAPQAVSAELQVPGSALRYTPWPPAAAAGGQEASALGRGRKK